MDKSFKNLIIFFVILVVLYLINLQTQKNNQMSSDLIFNKNQIENIEKIIIKDLNGEIILEKLDSTWTINQSDSLLIKERVLDNFFNRVLKVKQENIITEKIEKYIKYGVDDSTGIHVTLMSQNDEKLASYIFGRAKAFGYMRYKNQPQVYLINDNISYMLNSRIDYWGEPPIQDVPLPVQTQESNSN
tara:strand:+ start:485 stop:1048 length:564 start_codon:yes stop_codon:yes gene_type:complete